jgi:hypothetical protein
VAGPEMNKLHVQSLLQSAVARKTQAGGASIEKVPTVANPVVDLGPWPISSTEFRPRMQRLCWAQFQQGVTAPITPRGGVALG